MRLPDRLGFSRAAGKEDSDRLMLVQETVSMPERCGSLPRLDIVAPKDPLQHHDAPMSALGRCPDLQEPSGLSPKGSCRSLGALHPQLFALPE